jgi:hypothetical protein
MSSSGTARDEQIRLYGRRVVEALASRQGQGKGQGRDHGAPVDAGKYYGDRGSRRLSQDSERDAFITVRQTETQTDTLPHFIASILLRLLLIRQSFSDYFPTSRC